MSNVYAYSWTLEKLVLNCSYAFWLTAINITYHKGSTVKYVFSNWNHYSSNDLENRSIAYCTRIERNFNFKNTLDDTFPLDDSYHLQLLCTLFALLYS